MPRVTLLSTPIAYLVGPGKVKVVNGRLAYSSPPAGPVRLDPEALTTLLCFGPVGVTDDAMTMLFQHEVEVAWLTMGGTRCRGRLVRADPTRAALRMRQHQAFADPSWRVTWARWLVEAKIQSQLHAVRHYQRHGVPEAGEVVRRLNDAKASAATATLEQLRGVEGGASAAWFGLLGRLLVPPWTLTQRVRRPPTDPVNALLSLGYTWLVTRVGARCEAAGLEVYLGGYHEYRAGRPSLACDVMEPLRIPAVDRWVIGLCNQGQVSPTDFLAYEGGIRLQPGEFGRILHAYETHWQANGIDEALSHLLQHLTGALRLTAPAGPASQDEPDDL